MLQHAAKLADLIHGPNAEFGLTRPRLCHVRKLAPCAAWIPTNSPLQFCAMDSSTGAGARPDDASWIHGSRRGVSMTDFMALPRQRVVAIK